ncbi:MAG: arginine--tRNA ligase, partial [Burkholderiaceae bacterium]
MLPLQRQAFGQALHDNLTELAAAKGLGLVLSVDELITSLQQPKQPEHGDLATSLVLKLAKPWQMKPPVLAQEWVSRIAADDRLGQWLTAAEVAGPGFVNFRLRLAVKTAVVGVVLEEAEAFGHRPQRAD